MTALLACCLLLLSFLSLSCKAFRYFPSTSSPVRIVRLQLSPLYDWVISQGAKENDIKVFFDTPVCASSFIKKGDVLFSIPLGSCIEVIGNTVVLLTCLSSTAAALHMRFNNHTDNQVLCSKLVHIVCIYIYIVT